MWQTEHPRNFNWQGRTVCVYVHADLGYRAELINIVTNIINIVWFNANA